MTTSIYNQEQHKPYCVYITFTHSSTELPPLYIGKGKTKQILAKKYFGSVSSKKYKERYKKAVAEGKVQLFVITEFDTDEEAMAAEMRLHEKYDVATNICFVNQAKCTSTGFSVTGINFSEETRQKMSAARKGKPKSEETRQKMSAARKGKSPSNKGRKPSEETRQKISKALKGENNPFFGKKHSEESKAKMRKKRTEEICKKMSVAMKGIPKRKVTCPHCNRTIGANTAKRWHFDNCKFFTEKNENTINSIVKKI